MFLDDLDNDFLGDDESGQSAAQWVARTQRDVSAWAAEALVNRHPDVVSYRGKKGLLACRQDLEFHLAHLQTSLASDDADAMVTYARWIAAVVSQRGMTPRMLRLGVDVLAEGLLRFLPWPHGTRAVDSLLAGFTAAPSA